MARKQKSGNKQQPRKRNKDRARSQEVPPKAPSTPPAIPNTYPWWTPAAIIFALAFVLYGQTLSYGYALDDAIVITENDYTQEGFAGLNKIFTTDAFEGYFGQKKNLVSGGRYRPLSVATFAAEIGVFGANSPGWSHFFNIVLYGLTGIVLYFLLLMLFPAREKQRFWLNIAFIATVIFMAHPIHTEVVANIKGRDELMALLLVLLSMYGVMRYVDFGKIMDLTIAGGAFFLALLAKETALPFFVIIPMTIYFFRKANSAQYGAVLAAITAPLAAYFVMRFSFVGMPEPVASTEILNDPFIHATYGEQLATVSHTLGLYLGKLLLPLKLSHDYYFNEIPITGWGSMEALIPLVIYLGLGAAATWGLLKKHVVGYGILFFLLSLSIVSNIAFPIGTTMGERFVYVPSLGLIIAVIALFDQFAKSRPNRDQLLLIVSAAITLFFVARTVIRNPAWKDNLTLFTTDVHNSPNSAKVRTAAAGALVDFSEQETNPAERNKMLREAITHATEAVRIYPEHGNAWLILGNAHFKFNENYAEALKCFQTAIRFRPGMLEPHQNAAVTSSKMKQYQLADYYYKRCSQIRPSQAIFWYERGINYENWNKPDSALMMYEQTVKMEANNSDAIGKIGMIYGKFKQDFAKAIEFGQRAMAISPEKEWLYENVGIAQAMSGNPQAAIQTFEKGLQQSPNSAKLYQNLGITYINLGDTAKAQGYFQKAKELGIGGG